MPQTKQERKPLRPVGVRLEESVLMYLDDLAERDERSRNYFINRIIREHAQQNGSPFVKSKVNKLAEARG